MANRFLETNFYKSPFVRSRKGAIKALYSFIICDCTPCGFWSKDMEAASLYIGFDVNETDFKENLVDTGKAIELSNGKYFFPDFIEHQYPKGLQENNIAHVNIISELIKFDLLKEADKKIDEKGKVSWHVNFKKKFQNFKPLERPFIERLTSFIGKGNGNGNGVGNGNGEGNGVGVASNEKYIIPQMCELWYTSFSTYTKDKDLDFEGMGKVLQFIIQQSKEKNIQDSDNQVKILNTLQLIADQVNREPFWVNKPIKSIANNIQEFYNQLKNPNGSKNGTTKSATNGHSREGIQAEFNKRYNSGS